MCEFKLHKKIALQDCPVTKIIQNPYNPSEAISCYLNGSVHIWKLPKLCQQRKINLNFNKITACVRFQSSKSRGFLFGVRNGQLSFVNENFQLVKSLKVHKQSISEIIISNQYIITVGYDGWMLFLNKQTYETEKSLDLGYPLLSATEFEGHIYAASIKSFVVDTKNLQIKQIKRFNSFVVANNKIIGSSDDRGLSFLKSNSNSYLPSEFILPYERKVIIFSQKSISIGVQMGQFQYKAKRYSFLSPGESITAGFTCENNIYFGGNQGNIYWISESRQLQDLTQ